jgi:hypothetical protein
MFMDPIFDKYGVSYINFSISSIHINMFLDGGVSSFSINQNQGPNESMYFVCFFFCLDVENGIPCHACSTSTSLFFSRPLIFRLGYLPCQEKPPLTSYI